MVLGYIERKRGGGGEEEEGYGFVLHKKTYSYTILFITINAN
ncbi:MAG: hypothetical protein ACM3VV_07220 [Deltaproteobacteria bacterium]